MQPPNDNQPFKPMLPPGGYVDEQLPEEWSDKDLADLDPEQASSEQSADSESSE